MAKSFWAMGDGGHEGRGNTVGDAMVLPLPRLSTIEYLRLIRAREDRMGED